MNNISTASVTVDVAIVDGTGSSTYCGGATSITVAAGGIGSLPCPPNPNNFASYCRITITSSGDAAVRGNHCLVDSFNDVKFCSEAR